MSRPTNIRFRAKRLKDGKMIEGYYVQLHRSITETRPNGTIVKVGELIETPSSFGCDGCELKRHCRFGVELCRRGMGVFRFSQLLTDKINNDGNE